MGSVKLKIKTGDTVKIIAGKDKLTEPAKVIKVLTEKQRVVVEGRNIVSKHVKPNAKNPNGGIEKIEAPIHVSNVKLVDPKTGETTRVGRKSDDKGNLQRYSKKTGDII